MRRSASCRNVEALADIFTTESLILFEGDAGEASAERVCTIVFNNVVAALKLVIQFNAQSQALENPYVNCSYICTNAWACAMGFFYHD